MKKQLVFESIVVALLVLTTAGWRYIQASKHNSASSTTQPDKPLLLGLGDSVASGAGLYTASDASICDRNTEAYPYVLADMLGSTAQLLACSGASIQNGVLHDQLMATATLPSQVGKLPTTPPQLITLTIGANDVKWSSFIVSCVTANCGSDKDTADLSSAMTTLSKDLSSLIARLTAMYPSAHIIVTGYYRLFPETNSLCKSPSLLSDNELAWLDLITTQLNSSIQDSLSSYPPAQYIEPDFSGHEICTADPWIMDIGEKAPYHPNEAGQHKIAEQIYAKVQ